MPFVSSGLGLGVPSYAAGLLTGIRPAIHSGAIRQNLSRRQIVVQATKAAQQEKPDKPQQKKKSTQQKEKSSHSTGIASRSEDFSRWYLDVVREAQLADYGPVRGTMVIRPYGYAIWEAIKHHLDKEFKATGHQNAYFPQLIPLSFLEKEAEHVEGFAPELALVTKGGGKDLEEPLAIRPTSETIVNHMFSQWIQSYRDLPLLLNQWSNVHRWEMRTRPFIRTLEFLWQEGHTAHATAKEAEEETLRMLAVYEKFAVEVAAMPVIAGRKSKRESFAGANCTYTIEAMMGDRKALQAGTSHNLGDNFARAFGTQYLDENNELQHVHQSSWGVSTRLVGGIIMTHGDDMGLRLPPRLAPVQVVIIPIGKGNELEEVTQCANRLSLLLQDAGIRTKLDDTPGRTPGWKFNHHEMRGVPIRVEIGPRDLKAGTCVLARRDNPSKEGKIFGVSCDAESFLAAIEQLLDDIQVSMLNQARDFRDSNIVDVTSYEEMRRVIADGKWARGPWAGTDEEEDQVKEATQATLRCFPMDQPEHNGICFMTGRAAKEVAIFSKSY